MSGRGQFQGRISYKVDVKGRIPFPPHWFAPLDLRRDEKLIAARGLSSEHKFLEIYSPQVWKERLALFDRAFPEGSLREQVIRWYVATAEEVELDAQNRIRLPRHLMEFAGIDKDLVFLGCIDHIEAWAKEALDRTETASAPDFDQIFTLLNKAKAATPKEN